MAFMSRVTILGGNPQTNGGLVAQHFPPDMIINHIDEFIKAIEGLTAQQAS
jgi:hypothetical protein